MGMTLKINIFLRACASMQSLVRKSRTPFIIQEPTDSPGWTLALMTTPLFLDLLLLFDVAFSGGDGQVLSLVAGHRPAQHIASRESGFLSVVHDFVEVLGQVRVRVGERVGKVDCVVVVREFVRKRESVIRLVDAKPSFPPDVVFVIGNVFASPVPLNSSVDLFAFRKSEDLHSVIVERVWFAQI